jgi:hypothetical protein
MCEEDGPPPLLVSVPYLMTRAVYASFGVVLLMFIHYIQPLAKGATKAHAEGLAEAASQDRKFEVDVCCKRRKFDACLWGWMRRFDWPWLEAEFEGDAFYNFVVTLILEAVLNATNTANTHLEGDLFFSNDPDRVVVTASWLLSGMEVLSIIFLITELRRSKGLPCLCIKPHAVDREGWNKEHHRAIIVQSITWLSLVHDAFQITISSAATASQVASNNYVRSAFLINTIEVSALVFVKLFNLMAWAKKWHDHGASAKLKRATSAMQLKLSALREHTARHTEPVRRRIARVLVRSSGGRSSSSTAVEAHKQYPASSTSYDNTV